MSKPSDGLLRSYRIELKIVRYFSEHVFAEKRCWCNDSIARLSLSEANIASHSPRQSPTDVRRPYFPSSKISDGPYGQFVLMTGVPQARTSVRDRGNASKIEEEISASAA